MYETLLGKMQVRPIERWPGEMTPSTQRRRQGAGEHDAPHLCWRHLLIIGDTRELRVEIIATEVIESKGERT